MTPAALVALVEPHLPIGGYAFADIAHDEYGKPMPTMVCIDAIDYSINDATNLMLGAIVAEYAAGIQLYEEGDGLYCEIFDADGRPLGAAVASTPFEAALLARSEARKKQSPAANAAERPA